MDPVLAELIALLQLEPIEHNLFRGQSQDLGWGQVFGGQVLGQALAAAARTVPPDRHVHSLHGYFLRPGDVRRPVVYQVERTRDGRSFTTRNVSAVQGGEAILTASASFQVEEGGLDHQDAAPHDVPGPDGVASVQELAAAYAEHLPEPLRSQVTARRPIEIRPLDRVHPLRPRPAPPHRRVWMRAVDALPDDPAVHRMLLAYASDFNFLTTALHPHGVSWLTPGMQVTSLDHALWFHRPFRFDEWLLYDITSPNASGARGLVFGRIFDRAGRLVASAAQEGLIRDRR